MSKVSNDPNKATENYARRERERITTKKKEDAEPSFFSLSPARALNAERKKKKAFSLSFSLLYSLSAVSSTSTSSPLWYASIMMSQPPKKLPAMYTCGKVGQAFRKFFF